MPPAPPASPGAPAAASTPTSQRRRRPRLAPETKKSYLTDLIEKTHASQLRMAEAMEESNRDARERTEILKKMMQSYRQKNGLQDGDSD